MFFMEKMMEKCFAGMTSEEKQKIMQKMMTNMMKNMDMSEMMSKMMPQMMTKMMGECCNPFMIMQMMMGGVKEGEKGESNQMPVAET